MNKVLDILTIMGYDDYIKYRGGKNVNDTEFDRRCKLAAEVMQYKNCYQDIEGMWCYDYCDGVGCYEYLQYRFDLQHDYMSATWVEPTLEELLIWGSTVEW